MTIEPKFPEKVKAICIIWIDLPSGRKYGCCYREIKRGAFLWHIGRSEIDRYAGMWPLKTGRFDCMPQPFAAFLHGRSSQTDDVKP
jgi:hypothetical protein